MRGGQAYPYAKEPQRTRRPGSNPSSTLRNMVAAQLMRRARSPRILRLHIRAHREEGPDLLTSWCQFRIHPEAVLVLLALVPEPATPQRHQVDSRPSLIEEHSRTLDSRSSSTVHMQAPPRRTNCAQKSFRVAATEERRYGTMLHQSLRTLAGGVSVHGQRRTIEETCDFMDEVYPLSFGEHADLTCALFDGDPRRACSPADREGLLSPARDSVPRRPASGGRIGRSSRTFRR